MFAELVDDMSTDGVDDVEAHFGGLVGIGYHDCEEVSVEEFVQEYSFFAENGREDVVHEAVLGNHLFNYVVVFVAIFVVVGSGEVDVPDFSGLESVAVDLETYHLSGMLVYLGIVQVFVADHLNRSREHSHREFFILRYNLRHSHQHLCLS